MKHAIKLFPPTWLTSLLLPPVCSWSIEWKPSGICVSFSKQIEMKMWCEPIVCIIIERSIVAPVTPLRVLGCLISCLKLENILRGAFIQSLPYHERRHQTFLLYKPQKRKKDKKKKAESDKRNRRKKKVICDLPACVLDPAGSRQQLLSRWRVWRWIRCYSNET